MIEYDPSRLLTLRRRPVLMWPTQATFVLDGVQTVIHRLAADDKPCFYGGPGDLLWGRSPYWYKPRQPRQPAAETVYDEFTRWTRWVDGRSVDCPPPMAFPWRSVPHRFMNMWMSFIWCEVTSVERKRVWDITEQDLADEGYAHPLSFKRYYFSHPEVENPMLARFAARWERKYGPDTWKENPSVWSIRFRLIPLKTVAAMHFLRQAKFRMHYYVNKRMSPPALC